MEFDVIAHLPERFLRVVQRHINPQEEVEHPLLRWVRIQVIPMALHTSEDFTETQSLLLAHAGVMCNGASILHGYHVPHFVIHLEDEVEELRLHLNEGLIHNLQRFQLVEQGQVADQLLHQVGSVQRIDAIGADNASLDLYSALALVRAGSDAEEPYVVQGFLGEGEQPERVVALLLLLGLDVVVDEVDLHGLGQLCVDGFVDAVVVLVGDNLLAGVEHFG
mmetsp:Transcript_23236/g.35929  ORF Transcript_23236/g.35929 Transcript_23236/m.35929 type:complete len:221 (-) Transcript_23236:694-1356(-)